MSHNSYEVHQRLKKILNPKVESELINSEDEAFFINGIGVVEYIKMLEEIEFEIKQILFNREYLHELIIQEVVTYNITETEKYFNKFKYTTHPIPEHDRSLRFIGMTSITKPLNGQLLIPAFHAYKDTIDRLKKEVEIFTKTKIYDKTKSDHIWIHNKIKKPVTLLNDLKPIAKELKAKGFVTQLSPTQLNCLLENNSITEKIIWVHNKTSLEYFIKQIRKKLNCKSPYKNAIKYYVTLPDGNDGIMSSTTLEPAKQIKNNLDPIIDKIVQLYEP